MIRTTLCCLLFGYSSLSLAEMRIFTSADGAKSLNAELVDFDQAKQTITIRLEGGRQLTTPLTAFSEEDQAYTKAAAERIAAGRMLAVNFDVEEGGKSEKKTSTRKITTVEEAFSVELRNNGSVDLSGLSGDYKVFVARDDGKAKSVEIKAGELQFSALSPRGEDVTSTDFVSVTKNKPLPNSECVGST